MRAGIKTGRSAHPPFRWGLQDMKSCLLMACLAALLLSAVGCDSAPAKIELTADELERRERAAIDRLRAEGCQLEETEDELIQTRGILLRLFPEHLDDSGAIHSALIREIRDLRRCFLILDGVPIKPVGLAALKEINNLYLLSVQRAPINDDGLRQIEGIVSLRLLRLNRTRVGDDGLRHINRLPELKMLYLSGTQVTDDGVRQLVILKDLKALQLAETRITDKGAAQLGELTQLEFLNLRQTQITDASIDTLKKLKRLKHVDITDTQISAEGFKSLKDALPDCYVTRELTFRSKE